MHASVAAITCLLALSCDFARSREVPKAGASTSEQVSIDAPDVVAVETGQDIRRLEAQIADLKTQVDALKNELAYVRTDEPAYAVARTPFGPVIVIAHNAAPYLDGYKIKLGIGNLTTASFRGAKMHIEWGPPYEAANPQRYWAERKTKEFAVTSDFRPGAYTMIEVVATPAIAEEVKNIAVGVEFNELSLRR